MTKKSNETKDLGVARLANWNMGNGNSDRGIEFEQKCGRCGGTGIATDKISFDSLERLYSENLQDSYMNKKKELNWIKMIKAIRHELGFNLVTAKWLVETYTKYLKNLDDVEKRKVSAIEKTKIKLLDELLAVNYADGIPNKNN